MEGPRLEPDSPEVLHATIMNILENWPPKIRITKEQYLTILATFPEDENTINHAIDARIVVIQP